MLAEQQDTVLLLRGQTARHNSWGHILQQPPKRRTLRLQQRACRVPIGPQTERRVEGLRRLAGSFLDAQRAAEPQIQQGVGPCLACVLPAEEDTGHLQAALMLSPILG